MNKKALLVFILLSNSVAFAGPTQTLTVDEAVQVKPRLQDYESEQDAEISEKKSSGFYYRYSSSLSFNIGTFVYMPDSGPLVYGLFGLAYQWKSLTSFHFETGIDTTTSNEALLWTSGRWNFRDTYRFRPFVSAGLGIRLQPEGQLAAIFQHRYAFVRSAAGFESTLTGPSSVKMEVFASYDLLQKFFFGWTLGYVLGL